MESDESVSQSSEYSTEDFKNISLNQLYKYSIERKAKLISLLEQHCKLEENNYVVQASRDEHEFLTFKIRFLNQLLKQIQKQYPQQWQQFPIHIQLDVKRTLKEELGNLRALLDEKVEKLKKDRTHLADLEDRIKKQNDMVNIMKDSEAQDDEGTMQYAASKLNRMFKHYKSQLNDMLDELFPDGVTNILEDVCKVYFDDNISDPYISLQEDYQWKYVQLLLDSCIITRHPHDKTKIRLTNFFE